MCNRRLRLFLPLVLIIALPLLAQSRGGGVTIHYALAGVPCIDCRNPDPDCAAHSELHRSYLPDSRWADRDFWPMLLIWVPDQAFALRFGKARLEPMLPSTATVNR